MNVCVGSNKVIHVTIMLGPFRYAELRSTHFPTWVISALTHFARNVGSDRQINHPVTGESLSVALGTKTRQRLPGHNLRVG